MNCFETKFTSLKGIIEDMGSVLVAFSGGVDSTFLLKISHDVLGENAVAITATSPTYPQHELNEAKSLAKFIGCRHELVESNELEIAGFSENSPRRCYYCKSELFTVLSREAKVLGLSFVADGSNCDDLGDYRPGRDAAKELDVRSPLIEAGLTKDEIRQLSKKVGLPTWNKPSFACLSSRFPYGTSISHQRVEMIEACEDILRKLSFGQFRVRYHGETARIEISRDDFNKIISGSIRDEIIASFRKQGFKYIALDLEGYRTGSMNEAL